MGAVPRCRARPARPPGLGRGASQGLSASSYARVQKFPQHGPALIDNRLPSVHPRRGFELERVYLARQSVAGSETCWSARRRPSRTRPRVREVTAPRSAKRGGHGPAWVRLIRLRRDRSPPRPPTFRIDHAGAHSRSRPRTTLREARSRRSAAGSGPFVPALRRPAPQGLAWLRVIRMRRDRRLTAAQLRIEHAGPLRGISHRVPKPHGRY